MLKFVSTFTYSDGSWARMLQHPEDDRQSAVADLLEYLGGSLETIYWDVSTAAAYVTADLPDSVTAAAVITAAAHTGAFKRVEAHEVLTQAQLADAIALARSSRHVYRAPGVPADDPRNT